MTIVGDLLPPDSSGPWEGAVAAGMSDLLPVPYDVLMDPYRCPVEFQPWLAAHYSVDLWYEDWPEARKREVIAQAAGRSKLYPGEIAELKGTRLGARRYLEHVEGQILDFISHPHRPFTRHYAIGRMLYGHPPFKAVYLIKVTVPAPKLGYCVGRHPVGRRPIRKASLEPLKRASRAVRVAKAPETQILLDFRTARPLRAGDAVPAGDAYRAGQYLSRSRLGPNK